MHNRKRKLLTMVGATVKVLGGFSTSPRTSSARRRRNISRATVSASRPVAGAGSCASGAAAAAPSGRTRCPGYPAGGKEKVECRGMIKRTGTGTAKAVAIRWELPLPGWFLERGHGTRYTVKAINNSNLHPPYGVP